jgi:hypothetical protein
MISRSKLSTSTNVIALGMCALVAAAIGCSKEKTDPNRATVSGTVTFSGQPLPAGSVSIESPQLGIATSAQIQDGQYATDRAPTGNVVVGISTSSVKYGNPPKYVAIPEKYADSGTSGLTVEIKPGANENVNFDLK